MKNTYYCPQAFDPSAALRAGSIVCVQGRLYRLRSGQAFSALQQFTIADFI
jgi:hypothetical protein